MIQEYIAVRRMTQGHNLGICQMPDSTVSIVEILQNNIETVKYNSRDLRRGSQKNDWDLSGHLPEEARSLSLEPPQRRIC